MTFDQIIGTLIVQFGNRLDLRGSFCQQIEYLKEFKLEDDPNFTPYFLLEPLEDLAFSAGVASYNLPTGFIKEYEYGFAWQDNETVELIKESYDFNQRFHKTADESIATAATPTRYSIVGSKMHLYPVPNASGVIRIQYYKKTGRLKGDNTNPWVTDGADWLLNELGALVAEEIQHNDLAVLMGRRAQTARLRLMGKTEERHSMNQRNLRQ